MSDPVVRRVAAILMAEVRRAYGNPPSEPDPSCPSCDGDGCEDCDWTGDYQP